MRRILFFSLVLALGAFSACSSGGGEASTEGVSQLASGRFVGEVVESMDAAGYTYVKLTRGGESIWAAGPVTPVSVGDELAVSLDMPMSQFHSEALDRTFDTVYFTGSIVKSDGGAMAGGTKPGSKTTDGAAERTHVDGKKVAEVEPLTDGIQVGALWAQKASMGGKKVKLRGEVVKFNAGIMGRNWLHLQDGSGDSGDQTHDLTVTTDAQVAVGDLVTVEGTVALDQDFGSGYKYALIVEKASIKVETAAASGESR